LTQRSESLSLIAARVVEWELDLEALRRGHADCAEPRPALSLERAEAPSVRRLIEHAQRNTELRSVLPLFLRWLAESSAWSSSGIPIEDCSLLEELESRGV